MKKMKRSALTATAALMALTGVANAAPAELNIYGSSDQFYLWANGLNYYATMWLGCSAKAPVSNGGKHYYIEVTRCTSTLVPINTSTNQRDLDIRISSASSAEGVLAVHKMAALDSSLVTDSSGIGCSQNYGYRAMYASADTTVCKQVHVGISDVAYESLNQISIGQKFGPMGGGQRTFSLYSTIPGGLTPHSTVVVPFGFFVNSAVTAKQCTFGLTGSYCLVNTDCDTAPGNATGTCGAASTITNISRTQAAQIFSGSAADWSDFGSYFTPQQIVACLRHAGSGSHAALDLTVMSGGGTGWGSNLVLSEDKTGAPGKLIDGGAPRIWFNQGSDDVIKCVNGNIGSGTGSLIGAIGYANADQSMGISGRSQNVKQLKYNGVYPTRTAIRNGLYDFYTEAQFYTNPANGSTVNYIAESLATYAQNPANILSSKANYWAAYGEMNYMRNCDQCYPSFQGASIPMLP